MSDDIDWSESNNSPLDDILDLIKIEKDRELIEQYEMSMNQRTPFDAEKLKLKIQELEKEKKCIFEYEKEFI